MTFFCFAINPFEMVLCLLCFIPVISFALNPYSCSTHTMLPNNTIAIATSPHYQYHFFFFVTLLWLSINTSCWLLPLLLPHWIFPYNTGIIFPGTMLCKDLQLAYLLHLLLVMEQNTSITLANIGNTWCCTMLSYHLKYHIISWKYEPPIYSCVPL